MRTQRPPPRLGVVAAYLTTEVISTPRLGRWPPQEPRCHSKLGLKRDVLIQRDFVPLELWHYVERVRAPFLLLVRSESTIVGQDQQTRFRQICPDIEIVTVQGAGHIIVHDKPEEFEGLVLDFLRRHEL